MRRALVAAVFVALLTTGAAGNAGVAGRSPVPVTTPRVEGVAEVGVQLSARSGTWLGARPIRIAYRWQRCAARASHCVVVAQGRTYTIRAADSHHLLRVLVRVSNRHGAASAASRATGPVSPPPTVDAAGDIACDPTSDSFNGGSGTVHNCRELSTSDLIVADQPSAVLPLGDDQYECGRTSAYEASYGPTWGREKAVTHPVPGNHEYGRVCGDDNASPYFDYFGSAAGPRYEGWYSYDLGTWHMIAINSECGYGTKSVPVGGCQKGSAEEKWLQHDLATHHADCTLAYWHQPRFSSGEHGDDQEMAAIWNDLAAAHADIVLSGHNHDYERFDPLGAAPQSSAKYQEPIPDPSGIREFVVGTGGRNHYGFGTEPPLAGEVVRDATSFGVLHLTLGVGTYSWVFEPVSGSTFTDSGSGTCH